MPFYRLVKLVRDRSDEHRAEPSGELVYKPIEDKEEYLIELRKKLVEEAIEYMVNPCVEEMTDVAEVLDTLRQVDLKANPYDMAVAVRAKRDRRGGFKKRMGMYVKSLTVEEFDEKERNS